MLWQNKDMKERLGNLFNIVCFAYPLGFVVTAVYLELADYPKNWYGFFPDVNALLYFGKANWVLSDGIPLEPLITTIVLFTLRYLFIGKTYQI